MCDNIFPTQNTGPNKLAIIRGCLTKTEQDYKKLFIGPGGQFLTAMSIQAGLDRRNFFLGGLHNPEKLKEDLVLFGPDAVLLIGQEALSNANPGQAISTYRGTAFECVEITSPFFGYRCVATYTPEYVLQGNSKEGVVFMADLKKTAHLTPGEALVKPERIYKVALNAGQILEELWLIKKNLTPFSFDIEGGVNGISCCSIAISPHKAFIIPFFFGDKDFFSVEEEARILRALFEVLQDHRIPKILQNSLYDSFVCAWVWGVLIANVQEDTMLKHWELFPEMQKSLGFQTSFYTNEPYYKDERTAATAERVHIYCCKDSAVTFEISQAQESMLQAKGGTPKDHYEFNINLLRPLLYMELKGIRYDEGGAGRKRGELHGKLKEMQARIDQDAGGPLNTSSSKQMLEYLGKKGYKIPLNRQTGKPTANYEALLSLAKKHPNSELVTILRVKSIRTRLQMLNIRADDDGRIRCGYNVVGTETGRLTCYTSPTGSGYNLQTIPEYDRDLFLADPGYYMFQCDLSGADAWTVAAWAKSLGDPTMLEDLLAGIKVAKVIAAMTKHGPEIASLPRDMIKQYADQIPKTDPLYFGSKCVQHGSNYGLGKVGMSALIFVQSEGEISMSSAECAKMQGMYFHRYPGVPRWQEFVQARLIANATFKSASGHERKFGGDPRSHQVYKAALANEPQDNTTYATNKAALNLWNDPENRDSKGNLIIQPLHQVHDALIGQFPIEKTEWAVGKIRFYFNNTLTIANQQIKIPFEGGYGTSWGELKKGVI